ncbi:hypothetical protein RRG08_056983 [Elysia crispata]|uniref:Uncharacterized protein n=1 Tax=Elysia crispata TaxID=231223 RepID=A0AAE1DAI2_9GAST|nr:hypothetical protein RRG08_056983 [Elysia crispata]
MKRIESPASDLILMARQELERWRWRGQEALGLARVKLKFSSSLALVPPGSQLNNYRCLINFCSSSLATSCKIQHSSLGVFLCQ